MSTNAVQTSPKKQDIRSLLQSDAVLNQIRRVLPKHLTADRMARVMLTACIKTPKLLSCTRESLLQALMLCSQAGLEPDGRHAHLIPFKDTVQVIFDYKGLVVLAERNGVESIYADKVCENDNFKAWVDDGNKKLNHEIDFRKPRGTAYAYYASCRRNGRLDYEVMTKEEVDAIRKRSRASGDGPWVSDYDEMAKKTVLRRMSKRWDLSSEVAEIVNDDDDTPADISKAKRPAFGEDPFSALPEEPQQLAGATEKDNGGKKTEPAVTEPGKPEPVKTEPKKEPEPENKRESEPPAQDTTTPPEAVGRALEIASFKKAESEDEAAAFKRFDALFTALLLASDVTETQFMAFCKRQKLAKDNQNKFADLSLSKVVGMAKTWGTILPEIKKEKA